MTTDSSRAGTPDLSEDLLAHATEALFSIDLDPPPPEGATVDALLEAARGGGRVSRANAAARRWLGIPPDAAFPVAVGELPEVSALERRLRRLFDGESGSVRRVAEDRSIQRLLVAARSPATDANERRAERLQAAGSLVGEVAHDYHNLLTVVLGNAEIALGQRRGGDVTTHLEEIHAAARSAAALAQQLAALSHDREADPRPVGLEAVVHRVAELLLRLLDPSTKLEVSIADDLPRLRADPRQLEQALIGMVLCLREALPKSARLSIEATEDDVHELVHLVVRGSHPSTAAAPLRGAGLAIARRVIENSGGRLTVDQRLHEPALRVELRPVGQGPQPIGEETDGRAEEGTGVRVLLVDDHDVLRGFMARMLRSHGYEVHTEPNPDRALALPPDVRASFALILADVLMPGMSGPEFVQRWRVGCPRVPAVFTSGASRSREELERWLGTDWTLVEKPFRGEEMLAALRDALVR